MIAAQLDTLLIGSTVYARIINPENPAQVWNTDVEAFANRSSVSAVDMAVALSVDSTGYATANEPTGFPAGLVANCKIHEQAGGSPALDDGYAGDGFTNSHLVTVYKTTEPGVIAEAVADHTMFTTMSEQVDAIDAAVGEIDGRIQDIMGAGFNDSTDSLEEIRAKIDTLATSDEVTAIQNNTRIVAVVPAIIERPDSGSQPYRFELLLYDSIGNMEAPDAAPTVDLVNQNGDSRTSLLDSTTMTNISTGRYRGTLTISSTADMEQLLWTFSVAENSQTRVIGRSSLIVDTTAVDFTSADRTKLDAIHGKLPTKSRLAGTNNSSGDIQMNSATGNYPGSVGGVNGSVAGDVQGKLLGGGLSTISGVGAHVNNAAGEEMMNAVDLSEYFDAILGFAFNPSLHSLFAIRTSIDDLSNNLIDNYLAELMSRTSAILGDTIPPFDPSIHSLIAVSQHYLTILQSLAARIPAGMFIEGYVFDPEPLVSQFFGNTELSLLDAFYSTHKCVLTFTSGELQGMSNRVTGYSGNDRCLQFANPWVLAPQNGDTFAIVGRIEG